MNFGGALEELKKGEVLTRKAWNGPGQWVAQQIPDSKSKMKRRYLYICTVEGALVPWVPSITDIFAEDWGVVPGRMGAAAA